MDTSDTDSLTYECVPNFTFLIHNMQSVDKKEIDQMIQPNLLKSNVKMCTGRLLFFFLILLQIELLCAKKVVFFGIHVKTMIT